MEDDNITSPYFLKFMNDSLNYYQNNKKVIAISAYNTPVDFSGYRGDCYYSFYFSAWGYATWADRKLMSVEAYNDYYNEMLECRPLYAKVRKIHPKLIKGIRKIQDGLLDAGDYRIVFHSIKNDLYTVKPVYSFVDNTGHDGSGLYCGKSEKYKVDFRNISVKEFRFPEELKYDKQLDKSVYRYIHKFELMDMFDIEAMIYYKRKSMRTLKQLYGRLLQFYKLGMSK